HWDLLAAATHRRIEQVRTDRYAGPEPAWVSSLEHIDPENALRLAVSAPAAVRYQIPADIDALLREDEARANAWRTDMRTSLAPFMTIKAARTTKDNRHLADEVEPAAPPVSPIDMRVDIQPGAYDVVAFATDILPHGERENWYVLRRRGGEG